MKKVLILMLGLVAGTASFAKSSTPATATANAQSRLVMTTNHKLKLYVSPLQSKGELSICDGKGQPVYDATVSLQKGLSQQFDFSNLATGAYQLTLKADGQTLTRTFVVQADPGSSFVMQ